MAHAPLFLQFKQFASSLVEASRLSAKTMRHSCSDFSDFITSTAKHDLTEWPFFTVPDWSIHAENILRQTNSMIVSIFPEVSLQQAGNWTNYVLEHSLVWTNDTQVVPSIFYVKPNGSVSFDLDRTGPYVPVWQVYPVPQPPVTNFDMTTRGGFRALWNNIKILGEGILEHIMDSAEFGAFLASAREDIMQNTNKPYAFYHQPTYNSFNSTSKQMVADMTVYTRWGATFSGILPDYVRGIHLVLENTCNQLHTWEIVGNDVAS